MENNEIICSKCAETKPRYHGLQCKECVSARHRIRWALRTPEQRERRRLYERNRVSNRTKPRKPWIEAQHGLTAEQYEALVLSQNGRCGICDTAQPSGMWKKLVIDHCHETGRIRGLLCNKCNLALGQAGDSLDSVLRFIRYLAFPPYDRIAVN